jgi:hypothetical protein
MSEIARIASLMEQTFEGVPYYGRSVLDACEKVTGAEALRKPHWSPHCIWDIVAHLTMELSYSRDVVEGTAKPFGDTWPGTTDTSGVAWQQAIGDLTNANRALVRAVRRLEDSVLDEQPIRVRGPYYLMLHGTMQHNIYHAGQISLLAGQTPVKR